MFVLVIILINLTVNASTTSQDLIERSIDEFTLTPEELHKYFFHIETTIDEDLQTLFYENLTPIITKCTPSLLLPISAFQKAKRFWIIWDQTQPTAAYELIRIHYNHKKFQIVDIRYVFPSEEIAKQKFRDEDFLKMIFETDPDFPIINEIDGRYFSKLGDSTVVVSIVGQVIVKFNFCNVSVKKGEKLVQMAEDMARHWKPTEDLALRVSKNENLRKIIIGTRWIFRIANTNKQPPISMMKDTVLDIETLTPQSTHEEFVAMHNRFQSRNRLAFKPKHVCSNCGGIAEQCCERCKTAYFCSRKCQKESWKTHSKECTKKEK